MKWFIAIISALALMALAQATGLPLECGQKIIGQPVSLPLPAVVTGRVGFYAARYSDNILIPSSIVTLGDSSSVFPTASAYKTLVVHEALRGVDRGMFKLKQLFETTPANQSIERYPRGFNTLEVLADRTIRLSDNTASDLLHRAVGPAALARYAKSKSSCTNVLLTSKAWWAAQGGLLPQILGDDLYSGAQSYAALEFENRIDLAARLNAAAKTVTAASIEKAIDTYFQGNTYTIDLELMLQNTTTPQAFSNLMAQVMPAKNLQPATRKLFRRIMSTGCCYAKKSLVTSTYRAAKAGSGWRILTLTGYLELSNKESIAYAYFNDESETFESEVIEKQIRAVSLWIDQVILGIADQKNAIR